MDTKKSKSNKRIQGKNLRGLQKKIHIQTENLIHRDNNTWYRIIKIIRIFHKLGMVINKVINMVNNLIFEIVHLK